MVGTTRKKVENLYNEHLTDAIAGEDEADRARRASKKAKATAWKTLYDGGYAEVFGVGRTAPGDLHDMAVKCADIRPSLPDQGHRLDQADEEQPAELSKTATRPPPKRPPPGSTRRSSPASRSSASSSWRSTHSCMTSRPGPARTSPSPRPSANRPSQHPVLP